MCSRYLGFILLVWFPGALHAQSAALHCPAPSLVRGYFFPVKETYSHDSKLTYACRNTHKPAVQGWWAESVCQHGTWSHMPRCIEEQACIPPTIANAKYTEASEGWYEEGHIIRITCDKGYEHKDNIATAKCINGTWSSLPMCEISIKTCRAPPKIAHAVIVDQGYQELFPEDTELKYECEDGYSIEGSHNYTLFCLAGTWTEGPMCMSCGKDLSGLNKGDISSPSWPGLYAENADCRYTLSVEAHLQLELHFSGVFDVEQSPDGQCIDALRIETPSGIMGPFCGHTPPPSPFLTHSHRVNISFTSDGFGTNKGFTLHFKTRGKVCQAVATSHSTVTPQQPEYQPGQTVTVACDLGHIVNTQGHLKLSLQYETTCQSTGIWAPSYPCEPVNCGHPDIPEDGILQLTDSENTHTRYKGQIQLRCSSQYYTLEGNDKYTCSAGGKWVSSSGTSQMPKCTPVCGMHENAPASAGRILGGRNANLGEIPWQLLIKEPSRGGATLINDRWAVTAAHVVEALEETSLRLYGGLVDGRTMSLRSSDVVVMDSERIIIHPGYTRGDFPLGRINYDNDIALIRLTSRVNFGPNLLPICLPEVNRGLVENEQGTVSGWGLTEGKESLVTSRVLKYAEIGVYSLSQCQNTPRTPTGSPMIFTENMFCAGATGKDSCQKDSGSPFVIPTLSAGTGPFHLAGIVSWGPPCKDREFKGYYTKVENYVDWIKETIDKVENT